MSQQLMGLVILIRFIVCKLGQHPHLFWVHNLQRGQTALHIASQEGIVDSVRLLIRAKANVNAVDLVCMCIETVLYNL